MITKETLDLPMLENDADAATFRDYFKELLSALMTEEETFSGKRPLGNSGWKYELYKSIIHNKLIDIPIENDLTEPDIDGDDTLLYNLSNEDYEQLEEIILEMVNLL